MIPYKEIIFLNIKEHVFIIILSSRAILTKFADLAEYLLKSIAAFLGCSIYGLDMIGEASSDHNFNFLWSGFCLKLFLAEKVNFELWDCSKSTQIHVNEKENNFKKLKKFIFFFFRFSSNCPRCNLRVLKRFLGAFRHTKLPSKLLNTS